LESLVLKPKKLDVDYDEKNDVLYISIDKPKEADDSVEPQEGLVMRSRKGELVGITIVGLKGTHGIQSAEHKTRSRGLGYSH